MMETSKKRLGTSSGTLHVPTLNKPLPLRASSPNIDMLLSTFLRELAMNSSKANIALYNSTANMLVEEIVPVSSKRRIWIVDSDVHKIRKDR